MRRLVLLRDLQHGTGKLVAKLELANSGDPSISERSLVITKETSVDVSNYKYLTFWIKDNGTIVLKSI